MTVKMGPTCSDPHDHGCKKAVYQDGMCWGCYMLGKAFR